MPQLTPDPALPPRLVRVGARQRLVRGETRPPGATGEPLVVFGGDHAFGRDTERPWPARLAERLGRPVLNLAVEGAGPAFPLDDAALLARASGHAPVIVEAAGLWAVTNRWYAVGRRHPRRVTAASPTLRALYDDLTLDGITDLGRLLRLLVWRDPVRFEVVAQDVRAAWRIGAAALLTRLGPRAVLLTTPGATRLSAAGQAAPALAARAAADAGVRLALAQVADDPADAAADAAAEAVLAGGRRGWGAVSSRHATARSAKPLAAEFSALSASRVGHAASMSGHGSSRCWRAMNQAR
ncbi:MAG: DUF6473 family protein [Paracoccaceae bacterium]